MIETMVGDAIIHGIPQGGGGQVTGLTSISITGYASFILDRMEATNMADKYKLKNELGFDITGVAYNQRVEITIDFTPAASSRGSALLIPVFPVVFSSVHIQNVAVDGSFEGMANSIFNGWYLYEGDARILQQNGQPVKLTGLKLTQYADSGQNGLMANPNGPIYGG